MVATVETIEAVEQATGAYKYGFVTDIETEKSPKGLSEDVIRFISGKKMEPEGETIRLKLYIFGLQFIDLNISRLIIMAKTQPESSRYQSKSVYLSKSKL